MFRHVLAGAAITLALIEPVMAAVTPKDVMFIGVMKPESSGNYCISETDRSNPVFYEKSITGDIILTINQIKDAVEAGTVFVGIITLRFRTPSSGILMATNVHGRPYALVFTGIRKNII